VQLTHAVYSAFNIGASATRPLALVTKDLTEVQGGWRVGEGEERGVRNRT
jgi:hypothetical protein